MHLVSKENQSISLKEKKIKILKGETIHTENSHKYLPKEFEKLSTSSGFETLYFIQMKKIILVFFFEG